LQRAAIPPVSASSSTDHKRELDAAVAEHKQICATYPRKGAGIDAYVGSSQQLVGGADLVNPAAEKLVRLR